MGNVIMWRKDSYDASASKYINVNTLVHVKLLIVVRFLRRMSIIGSAFMWNLTSYTTSTEMTVHRMSFLGGVQFHRIG